MGVHVDAEVDTFSRKWSNLQYNLHLQFEESACMHIQMINYDDLYMFGTI